MAKKKSNEEPKKKKPKKEGKKKARRRTSRTSRTSRTRVSNLLEESTSEASQGYGLTEAQLSALRASYDRTLMSKGAIKAFSVPFAPAGDLAKVMVERFYNGDQGPDRLSARDRELVLLGFFVNDPGINLATHVYIALMEGVSPAQIFDTAYLMSLYRGADLWTGAAKTIQNTFDILAKAADGGHEAPTDTRAVLGALRNAKA